MRKKNGLAWYYHTQNRFCPLQKNEPNTKVNHLHGKSLLIIVMKRQQQQQSNQLNSITHKRNSFFWTFMSSEFQYSRNYYYVEWRFASNHWLSILQTNVIYIHPRNSESLSCEIETVLFYAIIYWNVKAPWLHNRIVQRTSENGRTTDRERVDSERMTNKDNKNLSLKPEGNMFRMCLCLCGAGLSLIIDIICTTNKL